VHGELTDAEVVARIAAGSGGARDAEAELCKRFAPRIRLYGLRHLRDEDRARDLVQAVLVAVLVAARAGRVKEPDKVARFVLGACRNVASRVRETEGRTELVAEFDEWPADLAATADAERASGLERVDLAALMHCVSLLEERARHVVSLSFQQGRPTEEVAARLGTSVGNVRVLRHRAVAALRRCLDGPSKEER
jgi:RNA polymerase sigma-70 factor (ECF subfamily)